MRQSRNSDTKFAPINGVSLEDAKNILRAACHQGRVGLAEVIKTLRCDAERADRALRDMCKAGYVLPSEYPGVFFWKRSPQGKRLALEKKINRIDRAQVDELLSELVARAGRINSDPDRLHRISLKLFGSALEDRDSYGDVDVSISFYQRNLEEEERLRIEQALVQRMSKHDRESTFGRLLGAELQDTKEIRSQLKKGLSHLSLMEVDLVQLATPFKALVDHDIDTDKAVDVRPGIVRPNKLSELDAFQPAELPPVTLLRAKARETSPSTKSQTMGLYIDLRDAELLDEAMWTPLVTSQGELVPNSHPNRPEVKFAGFQHLCPIWKEPLDGVLMLRNALDWCDENKVWVRDLAPMITLERSYRSKCIRIGTRRALFRVEVTASGPKGSLIPDSRTRISKLDLAGTYAVGMALHKMYVEAQCSKMPYFVADIWLPLIEEDKLPDLRKLANVSEAENATFKGLLRLERR